MFHSFSLFFLCSLVSSSLLFVVPGKYREELVSWEIILYFPFSRRRRKKGGHGARIAGKGGGGSPCVLYHSPFFHPRSRQRRQPCLAIKSAICHPSFPLFSGVLISASQGKTDVTTAPTAPPSTQLLLLRKEEGGNGEK